MKPKHMLDINICIYLMKHQPPEVREQFSACFVGDMVILAVTLTELEFGISRAGRAAQAANRTVAVSREPASFLGRVVLTRL